MAVALFITAVALIGGTGARYSLQATLSGVFERARVSIAQYHPEWEFGYNAETNSFPISSVPTEYNKIHYVVTNTAHNSEDKYEGEYYIRIVANDGSDDIPIEYQVRQYDTATAYPVVAGRGYGPFVLNKSVDEQHYTIYAKFYKDDVKYLSDVQRMKVQMVRVVDGALSVMSAAPLNMKYTGPLDATVTFAYYDNGTSPYVQLTTKTVVLERGLTVDFNNATQLSSLGIAIPSGYKFRQATGVITGWKYEQSITIPTSGAQSYWIEVYCDKVQ